MISSIQVYNEKEQVGRIIQNILFGEKKNAKKLGVTAKAYGKSKAVIVKRLEPLRRGLFCPRTKGRVPQGKTFLDPTP